jgi:hypothetical protein
MYKSRNQCRQVADILEMLQKCYKKEWKNIGKLKMLHLSFLSGDLNGKMLHFCLYISSPLCICDCDNNGVCLFKRTNGIMELLEYIEARSKE